MTERWIALAHLLRPQGRKGEVLAELLTDFPEKLVGRSHLYLAREGFAGEPAAARACSISASWMPKGRNEGRIVLAIRGVETIEAAEAVSGYDLLVEAAHREALEEGAAYISDLIGCSVFDGDQLVGVVEDVEFPTSSDGRRRLEDASPLLVVTLAGDLGEAMLPFIKGFLRTIDPVGKTIHMDLPPGLLDLSTATSGEES